MGKVRGIQGINFIFKCLSFQYNPFHCGITRNETTLPIFLLRVKFFFKKRLTSRQTFIWGVDLRMGELTISRIHYKWVRWRFTKYAIPY